MVGIQQMFHDSLIMNLSHLVALGSWAVNGNLWGSHLIYKVGINNNICLHHGVIFRNNIVRIFGFYYDVIIVITIIIPIMNFQLLPKKSGWLSPLKCIWLNLNLKDETWLMRRRWLMEDMFLLESLC